MISFGLSVLPPSQASTVPGTGVAGGAYPGLHTCPGKHAPDAGTLGTGVGVITPPPPQATRPKTNKSVSRAIFLVMLMIIPYSR